MNKITTFGEKLSQTRIFDSNALNREGNAFSQNTPRQPYIVSDLLYF